MEKGQPKLWRKLTYREEILLWIHQSKWKSLVPKGDQLSVEKGQMKVMINQRELRWVLRDR